MSFQQSFEDVQRRRLTDRIRKLVPRVWACYGAVTVIAVIASFPL